MEPEKAALLEAMLIGDKTGLTRSQKRLYEENGMAHLLTVSGLHVTIAAGRLFRFLRRKGISYRAAFLAGAAALLFYSLLTGSGNSVIRAGLMYKTFLTAELFGASYDMISAMCLAGILMLLDCPLRILDGGCMISFASVFTLGGLMPAADRLASAGRKPGKIGRALLGGLVFAGGTMPLLLRCFYQPVPIDKLYHEPDNGYLHLKNTAHIQNERLEHIVQDERCSYAETNYIPFQCLFIDRRLFFFGEQFV